MTLASGKKIAGKRSARAEFRAPSGRRKRPPERDPGDGHKPNYRGKQDGESEATQGDYIYETKAG